MEILELILDLLLICFDVDLPWFWIVAVICVLLAIVLACI